MNQKYAILRDLNARPARRMRERTFEIGVPTGIPTRATPPAPSVEVADLSARDLNDVARDPMVEAAAPAIPLRLIEPKPFAGTENSLVANGIAWGIRAVGADTSPFNGAGITVGVIDTGIDSSHDAFAGVTLEQRDFTTDGHGDVHGHGTHCAGTIFGRDVNGTRIGVAPGVTSAFIGKVFGNDGRGSGSAVLARAVQEAVDFGCQVISMSLGFDFPGLIKQLREENPGLPEEFLNGIALHGYRQNVRLFDRLGTMVAAQANFGKEVLLIAASGNESNRLGERPFELSAAPPSEAEEFIAVGAVGQVAGGKLDVAEFSNTGCNVCAPGVGVLSAKAGSKSGLVAFSGTSMATPHAAGVAALWLQKISTLSTPANPFSAAPRAESRLLGQATLSLFADSFDPFDVGNGIVQAPKD